MRERINSYITTTGKIKRRDYLEDIVVDGRII
jgi:hypothetical protein